MISILFVICIISAFQISWSEVDNVKQYNLDLQNTVSSAQRFSINRTAFSERLPIIIGFSYPIVSPLTEFNYRRFHYLHCSLHKVYNNIGNYTPIDVYLWVSADETSQLPLWIQTEYPQLIILPIPVSSWQLPTNIGPHHGWKHSDVFKEDYFIHSRWRMTFAMEFVKAMGYKYILLTDDDTFVMNPIPFNIIEQFSNSNVLMGQRERRIMEQPKYLTGLAEFTRYWMSIRNFSTPLGPLLKHLTPSSIDGLTTDGWDREIFTGCFSIINIDFWFSNLTSDYVRQILKSGGDMEQRWTEQAVQNMIRLLFVPEEQIFFFPSQYNIVHGKPKVSLLPQLNCPTTQEVLLLPSTTSDITVEMIDDAKVQKIIFLMGFNPLELADFDWHCSMYESEVDVSCMENPYFSLPLYIDAFCAKIAVTADYCNYLRQFILSSVDIHTN